MPKVRIAVLDDYQAVALPMADWSVLADKAEVTVFGDHLSDAEPLARRLAPFDVLCVMRERTPLPRALLQRLPQLKLIVSTGMRNASIDLAAAKELGITVCGTHSGGFNAAELTWALIMAAMRHIPEEQANIRAGGWQTTIGRALEGKTLGIVGLGKLGAAVARYAQAFGMELIAWSTNMTEEKAKAHGARLVAKEQLFREADIVTVHLVLSERTRGIIGARELALMKPTALFVNTSRGPLADEAALIDLLRRKAIAGAALDVFGTEPLPADHPFRSLDNVLATPHIGYVTQESYKQYYHETVECIAAWLEKKPIRLMQI
jgi:phosphoglycerate dehydrogenase-like enzyme